MISFIALTVTVACVVPLCLFTILIGRQGRRAPLGPAWYWCLVVSWLGGLLVGSAGLTATMVRLSQASGMSDWVYYALLFLAAPVGGSVGPGLIYLYLRLRRTQDPDYEDYQRK